MRAIGVGKTDAGRRRKQNEDRFLIDDALGLYVISDGMGGHAAGDVAATQVVESVERVVRSRADALKRIAAGGDSSDELTGIAEEAITQACRDVHDLATSDPSYAGMGATATLLLVAGRTAAMGHVGDSRLFLVRNREIHQLSTNHTMVERLLRSGALKPEEVKDYPYAHVLTRAVGIHESVEVDTLRIDVLPGDRLLLCSDGLTDYVTDWNWLRQTCEGQDFDAIPAALVDFANAEGGHDNITAVMVRIEEDETLDESLVAALQTDARLKVDALRAVFLFSDLSMSQLARVLNDCRFETYEPGATVVERGARCSSLFITVQGRLTISRPDLGKAELTAGRHVGETTLLRPRPSRASVRAVERSKVLVLDRERFLGLARTAPWLSILLLERLGRELSLELDQVNDRWEQRCEGAEAQPIEMF